MTRFSLEEVVGNDGNDAREMKVVRAPQYHQTAPLRVAVLAEFSTASRSSFPSALPLDIVASLA